MDIFSVLALCGGIAVFLYGMTLMGESLEKSAGSSLKGFLEKVTSNPFKAVLLGLCVTSIIQSSTATTVMVVGFVNSGIMELSQSIGVIMGANIGTTVTAWLLSLTGIESGNPFIQMLNAKNLAYIVSVVGIVMFMMSSNSRKKDIGSIFIGFSLVIIGMELMSDSVAPLAEVPEFTNILTLFTNPILGILMGAVLTAVVQSSSASIGIMQAIAATGSISYAAALPLIMGQNIGTCLTSILSSIGATKDAKRASIVHLVFNISGTVVCLIVYYILRAFITPDMFDFTKPINAAGIAVIHTTFNVFSTIVLFPFIKQFEKFTYIIIKSENETEETELLDERFLLTPSVAISQSKDLTHRMAQIAKNSLCRSLDLMTDFDEVIGTEIRSDEEMVDHYEDKLGTYLVKLSRKSMSVEDSHEVSRLLHTIGDFERISDHAVNILGVAEEVHTKKIEFSKEARHEVDVLSSAIREILTNTVTAFENEDLELAKKIEPLEQVIDRIKFKLKQRHITRLQNGECTIESGFIFSDFITNCERVADHCSNVAVCLIQVAEDSFDTHEYLQNLRDHGDVSFDELYKMYKEKYSV